MTDNDPLPTRRDVLPFVTDELSASGFDDAHEIGHGGFGVVYRCTQTALERTVAVKVLSADLDKDNRTRFVREQRAMGRLTGHPNIVSILEVGTIASGRPYLVMPYHPQDSLDARIRRHGPLTLEEVLRLGVKMAGALETAHLLGIVHRDVKPANILLNDYGEPVLADFGIAHIAGGFRTATGTVAGSPAYTAPEVLGGDPPSAASDVYGLGATLFAALTGHAAFERRSGEQLVAQFLRITTEPLPDLREHGLDADVSAVVEKAMSRNAKDRPSAAALGEDLQRVQYLHGLPVDDMALRAEPGIRGHDGAATPPVSITDHSPAHQPPPHHPSATGRTGNLPLSLTSFVGRRTELTAGKKLLQRSRLVTLTGIGGVGKTRLALGLADNVRRAFHEGVWLAELGELQDGSLLVSVVADALGLRPQVARPLQQILVEYLASRELLLVLDNCEQVIDAVADLAERLLHTCPGLRILATSRESLGTSAEVVLRVPPLRAPDPSRVPSQGLLHYEAVTLFGERAASAVPGFELTEDNRITVAQICHRLDGLPLAIELAAARLRAMSPEQILHRLTDRYTLLTRGSRDAPSRQQTLRWSVDWSHELCTPIEQQAWARLSVFAGTFELDAADEVCSYDMEPDDLLDTVTALVDKSILIREESGAVVRFRMLDTLRDYGRDKLQQAGEYPELNRRHRNWYRQLALDAESEWISPRQLYWIARLEREQPNLREALEFSLSEQGESGAEAGMAIATSLFPFWLLRGLLSEGLRWLDRALTHRVVKPNTLRVKALHAAGSLAARQQDLSRAIALSDEGRAIADDRGTARDRALIQRMYGSIALHSGDPQGTVTAFSQAVEVLRSDGDLILQIMTLHGLGLAHELLGQTGQGIACLEEAIRITRSHGESGFRGRSTWTLGLVMWREGDRDRAVTLLREGLDLARLADDPAGTAWCLEILAWISAAENHHHRAAVLLAAAEVLRQRMGTSVVQIPNLSDSHQECERLTRRTLGQREFAAAYREGEALSFDAVVAFALEEQSPPAPPHGEVATALTKRERQVADLVAQGLTNRAIAAQLVISQRTAQGHVEHILAKLGFTSRAQIATWVVERRRDLPD